MKFKSLDNIYSLVILICGISYCKIMFEAHLCELFFILIQSIIHILTVLKRIHLFLILILLEILFCHFSLDNHQTCIDKRFFKELALKHSY
jgi:hypothetical protein